VSDLLSIFKAGTDNHKIVKWPGTEHPVAIRILSQKDLQDAAFTTERMFKSEKIEVGLLTAEEYEVEKSIQILFRCLRDPKNLEEPVAPNIAEFRKALTREERRLLTDEYLAFESECSPQPDGLSKDDFDRTIEQLKKTPDAILSNITSIAMLKKLLLFMASQPVELPQAK
jgi:hypothetical protein